MKSRLCIFIYILSIFFAFFLVACDEEEESDLNSPEGETLSILAKLKPGSWEELNSYDGGKERYEYIGEDEWQGKKCMVMEFESTMPGESPSISQIWIDKSTSQGVVMFMKEGGVVYRFDITPTTPTGTQELPWEKPVTTKIGTDKYKTPTGKTVNVTKYTTTTQFGTGEDWISDEVPFGQVKSIYNGQVEVSLYDFGFSGAVRSISKQEAENAQPFSYIGGGNTGGGNTGGGNTGGGNVGGQAGGIKINVGAGPRPTITVSKPIKSLTVTGDDVFWGFEVPQGSLAGPFKYGVIPPGAEDMFGEEPPDLKTGSVYQFTAIGPDFENGNIMDIGSLTFKR